MKQKFFFAALLLLCSCSESASTDDGERDEVLSGTSWVQTYADNPGASTSDEYYSSFPFLPELRKELTAAPRECMDTITNIKATTGRLRLLFANKSCTLTDTKTKSGTSYIKTCTRTEYHYPDQSGTYQDGDVAYSYCISNDTLYVIRTYNGNAAGEGEQYMGRWNVETNVQTTTPEPYEKSSTSKKQFQFTRSGSTVYLTGDCMLTGIINDKGDEMKLGEYGTLYLE